MSNEQLNLNSEKKEEKKSPEKIEKDILSLANTEPSDAYGEVIKIDDPILALDVWKKLMNNEAFKKFWSNMSLFLDERIKNNLIEKFGEENI